MTAGMLHPTAAERARVQADARRDMLAEYALKAAQAAEMAAGDVREAQRIACDCAGAQALELLLREAIADARRLADRLALIAGFAGERP